MSTFSSFSPLSASQIARRAERRERQIKLIKVLRQLGASDTATRAEHTKLGAWSSALIACCQLVNAK
jgi:hypothetical protein